MVCVHQTFCLVIEAVNSNDPLFLFGGRARKVSQNGGLVIVVIDLGGRFGRSKSALDLLPVSFHCFFNFGEVLCISPDCEAGP